MNRPDCHCGSPAVGLHDVACPEAEAQRDQRVLDAMTAIPTLTLRTWIRRNFRTVTELAKAELARRGESET